MVATAFSSRHDSAINKVWVQSPTGGGARLSGSGARFPSSLCSPGCSAPRRPRRRRGRNSGPLCGSTSGGPDSVALGRRTIDQFDTDLDEDVELDFSDIGGPKLSFRVVGEVLMPPQGIGGRMDEGLFFSLAGLRRALGAEDAVVGTLFLAGAPGTDLDAVASELVERVEPQEKPAIEYPTTPADLVDLGRPLDADVVRCRDGIRGHCFLSPHTAGQRQSSAPRIGRTARARVSEPTILCHCGVTVRRARRSRFGSGRPLGCRRWSGCVERARQQHRKSALRTCSHYRRARRAADIGTRTCGTAVARSGLAFISGTAVRRAPRRMTVATSAGLQSARPGSARGGRGQ